MMAGHATSVYLPTDLRNQVVRQADARGMSASSIIVEAVRFKFAPKADGAEPLSTRHVARMETRLDKAIRDGIMMKETLLLFVRVWLEHNPPLDEQVEDAAAASAAARFERFLDVVANAIDSGKSLSIFEPGGQLEHGARP